MATKAVVDSGPIIHLSEIGLFMALSSYDVIIPEAVYSEITKRGAPGKKEVLSLPIEKLTAGEKEYTALLIEKYGLGLGEAEVLSIARYRKIGIVFVDDLDAREAATSLGLKPHGSVGILLRAYRAKILSKKDTIDGLHALVEDSSLFVTRYLIEEAVKAVERYMD
ncbi:MAG: hypothetical protein V3R93_07930 [Candidatus Hydrothermarchaeaceae archaeon]